ncbi:signal recognition particle subunit SRP68, putative [Plasmodium ovale]|uniref:Signal recognition particle subunit SRP68 n=2 Tax=Plasmodium ovale TaxID=36330 RepID=A0A1A8W2C7_PLAOA|nr:signal recognition particle subunit SRP68, putative [Plasmodium ovale curtisi]SBS94332.1 signal recognition particle subunit SRP68, putative [Plasmodium ovale curtisi]SCP05052.1 signal recognition particle subunit SRP68, putative [Plasmodium ovale]
MENVQVVEDAIVDHIGDGRGIGQVGEVDEIGDVEKVCGVDQVIAMGTSEKVSFDVFSYLINVYKKHGLYYEEIKRFLLYVKKRRAKLKSRVLSKVKKVGSRYISKVYEPVTMDEKYIELLLLDVELCRCRYIQIKTDVNNLKIPYRSKYCYLRRIKRAFGKMIFFSHSVNNSKVIDKNTELQVKCYRAYIEIAYLLETRKYEECIAKVEEFTKLIKLIKRITLNALAEGQKGKKEGSDIGMCRNGLITGKSTDSKEGEGANINNFNGVESGLVQKSSVLIEEEKKIDDNFEYFLSIVKSYEHICIYNMKKNKLSNFSEKLQDEDLVGCENKVMEIHSSSDYIPSVHNKLVIESIDDIMTITLKGKKFKMKYGHVSSDSILKIKNIMDETKCIIDDEIITKLNVTFNLKDITKSKNFPLFTFLSKYELNFLINNYGILFSQYYDCLSIVHEELIKSTSENNNFTNDDKLMENIWSNLEHYFLSEKLCTDTERTLLVLMKNLQSVYTNSDADNFTFLNKKTFSDIIDDIPLLQEAMRYTDILKQNMDELKNVEENNDIFINILQIIKNGKSLCLACYYALTGKNAEAHVLFDLIKTRNYVYIKTDNMESIPNKSFLRVVILFNRLQDIVSILNEKFYFRHLAIYALQIKTKSNPNESNLFYVDSSLFKPKMGYIALTPLPIDMTHICREAHLLNPDIPKEEKSSGIRGLLRSFWK